MKKIITIVLIFTLLVSARFISRQYDAESLQSTNVEFDKGTGRIYVCDRLVDLVATDESESRSRFVSSYTGNIIRVITHSEFSHLFLLICFSISLAITSSAAYYALAEAKQSCLVITKSIQKKDGKK